MNHLQNLLNEHWFQVAYEKEEREIKAIAQRDALVQRTWDRLVRANETWELAKWLGLRGNPLIIDDQYVRYVGEVHIDGVDIETYAQTPIRDYANIEIKLEEVGTVANYGEVAASLAVEQFRQYLLKFAVEFWTRRETVRAEWGRRLPVARKFVHLAHLYSERVALYESLQKEWVERWTVQLWGPWTLWRVRYVPVAGMAVADDEGGPETILCLEGPEAIVEALRHFPTATVRRVETDGTIREMEIPSFLDAERISLVEFSHNKALPYHRHYRAGGWVLNVPAHDERTPDSAPILVDFPQWITEVEDSLGDIARCFAEADYDWADIIERSAEQWVADWGRVFD